jgi:nucleoside-diphosphate-sugar epimerase
VPLLDEDGPLKSAERKYPHSPAASPFYGLTKAEGERALRREMEKGLAATIFRPGIVLGVHPTSCWAHQVPVKIRAGQVALRGDGNDPLPWTHVENLRYALELALDHPVSIGRAYNVFDGHISWRRYLEDVRSWFPDAPPAPTVEGESFIGRSSAARIVEELGYTTRRTYEEGMAEAGEWWRRGGPAA